MTAPIRRYAQIEVDDPDAVDPDHAPLLFRRDPRFRMVCDHCRMLRRYWHGDWTGEDRANDEADEHDRKHEREREWAARSAT